MAESQSHQRPVDFGQAVLRRDPRADEAWLLTVDGTAQSYLDIADPTHLEVDYIRRMAAVIDTQCSQDVGLRVLFLGAGLAALPRWVVATRSAPHVVAVDADARLVEWVHQVFAPAGFDLRHGDAAQIAASLPERSFDVAVVDCYVGHDIPTSVTAPEFVARLQGIVGDGIAVANISDARPFARIAKQVDVWSATFEHVALLADSAMIEYDRSGNAVLIGSAVELDLAALTVALRADPGDPRVQVGAQIQRWLT